MCQERLPAECQVGACATAPRSLLGTAGLLGPNGLRPSRRTGRSASAPPPSARATTASIPRAGSAGSCGDQLGPEGLARRARADEAGWSAVAVVLVAVAPTGLAGRDHGRRGRGRVESSWSWSRRGRGRGRRRGRGRSGRGRGRRSRRGRGRRLVVVVVVARGRGRGRRSRRGRGRVSWSWSWSALSSSWSWSRSSSWSWSALVVVVVVALRRRGRDRPDDREDLGSTSAGCALMGCIAAVNGLPVDVPPSSKVMGSESGTTPPVTDLVPAVATTVSHELSEYTV